MSSSSSTTTTATPYTLYSYAESGNSYKVRLLAALLSIPLTVTELDFLHDQQHSPEFLRINPRGEVPCLVDASTSPPTTLRDSSGILIYLAGKHALEKNTASTSSYWPPTPSPLSQALIADWLAFANSWVQYGVFTARAILSFKGPYNGLGTSATAQTYHEAVTRAYKSLDILEERLAAHDWLALDRPTVADVSVFVYVALSPMGDVTHEKHPAVRAWIARIKKLPGFIPMDGLEDPFYRRRADVENTHSSARHLAKPVPA